MGFWAKQHFSHHREGAAGTAVVSDQQALPGSSFLSRLSDALDSNGLSGGSPAHPQG